MKTFFIVVGAVIISIVLIISSSVASAVVPGTNQLVSKTSLGGLGNDHITSGFNALSADGNVLVFGSNAWNMFPSGSSPYAGYYAKDLTTGLLSRVNVSSSGDIANGSTTVSDISANGRYVLMSSQATNLVDGIIMPAGGNRLYLRDMKDATTTLISQTAGGVLSNATNENGVGVSSDGRYVAFTSNASNLHPDSTTAVYHLYMLDRSNNTMTILDRKSDGALTSSPNLHADMSCDGSLFALQTSAHMILSEPASSHVDIYLLDLRGGGNKLTNLTRFANSAVTGPTISCNGDYIGFKSIATNIDSSITVPSTENNKPFVYDRVNGTYHVVSVATAGSVVDSVDGCGKVWTVSATSCINISDKGLAVYSANDVAITGDLGKQVYQRNIRTNTTELLSKNSSGVAGNGSSNNPLISADGSVAAYSSSSTNLVLGDTNGKSDMFTSVTGY